MNTADLIDEVDFRRHALERISRALEKYPMELSAEQQAEVMSFVDGHDSHSLKRYLRKQSSSDGFSNLTKLELQKIARRIPVPRWSRLTKSELISGIKQFS